ncbi:MAG: DUF2029 domain-containing protein [Anaerolineales bacterium]|nr:DUF2029 domain-containing protein [Anaerolineales bacterium]
MGGKIREKFQSLKAGKLFPVIWWVLGIGIVVGCVINFDKGISGFDWIFFYYPQAQQITDGTLLNPLWIYFIIKPIALLPLPISYLVFLFLNLGLFWVGSNLAGGNRYLLLISFPAFWMLWFGQLDGFVLFGTALGLAALKSEKPIWMGIAILLILVKPHVGAPLALLFFIWHPKRETLLTVLLVFVLSLIVWGWDWPITWVRNILTIQEEYYVPQTTNISLFPYGLLAWLAILIPKTPMDRVKVALSATLLSVPYAATYSILPLLVLPLPWWVYLLASAPFIFGPLGYRLTMLVPVATIILVIYPLMKDIILKQVSQFERD